MEIQTARRTRFLLRISMLRKVIRKIAKTILFPFVKWITQFYLKDQKVFKYKSIRLVIKPKVFHPGLYLSTKILMNFLETLNLKNKKFLELGAGSGAVGFYAERLGAEVTLSDLNKIAIEGLQDNKKVLKSSSLVVYSDLFEKLKERYDIIVVNPPYYPKKPLNEEQIAWFCGEEFEYFHQFFSQLPTNTNAESEVFMILSEDCNLEKIKNIAFDHGYGLDLVHEEMKLLEMNYIFKIEAAK